MIFLDLYYKERVINKRLHEINSVFYKHQENFAHFLPSPVTLSVMEFKTNHKM